MPDAEAEIGRFPDYAGVFGKTAPSQAAVAQTLESAYEWRGRRWDQGGNVGRVSRRVRYTRMFGR